MVDRATIGNRIRDMRKNRRLSVEECCAAVGVSQSAWYSYENGDRMPRDEVRENMASLFRCSIYSIFFKE